MKKLTLKKKSACAFAAASLLLSNSAMATDSYLTNLSITRIRSVGDYQGTTFDQTFEIWFSGPVNYSSGSRCTSTYRVYIDAKNKHIYAAALLALAAGRKVNINVDDNLPIRDGACEVSFLDVES